MKNRYTSGVFQEQEALGRIDPAGVVNFCDLLRWAGLRAEDLRTDSKVYVVGSFR